MIIKKALASASIIAAIATGGTGNFYKTDTCSPFLSLAPAGRVTNYPYGTGQQIHYATTSTPTWKPYKVTVGGVKVTNPAAGYANWPTKGTILKTAHTWRSALYPWVYKTCTNET